MTFSILTFDPKARIFAAGSATGNLCVGGWVLKGDARYGLVASQGALPSTLWSEDVIELMSQGISASNAINNIVSKDDGREHRQISAIDTSGRSGIFSGSQNLPEICHIQEENLIASGNILENSAVLKEMCNAFKAKQGALEHRILNSLKKALEAGGDKRGLISASILILSLNAPPISLRIDYSVDPLKDLERLIQKCNEPSYQNWLKELPTRNA